MEDSITKVIELAAPVSRVWKALTDHEEFGQWFRVDLEGPFAIGETTRGRVNYPGYEHMIWEAKVQHMEPERRFVFTWPVDGDFAAGDYTDSTWTTVEFLLEPTPEGTRLTLTESGFSAVPEASRLEILRRNEGGWDEQAKNIAAHVAS